MVPLTIEGILYLMKHRIQLVFIYTDKIRVLEMQMYANSQMVNKLTLQF